MVSIELLPAADFHCHLRDGSMMETVVPTIRKGGVSLVYVMPNLVPPITTVDQALSYHSRLQAQDPSVTYLMTLYLSPSITPSVIADAAATGKIVGVKSYPKGLTTNSEAGVVSYEQYYPVFAAMEEHDLVLNLHGESPSSETTTILNAEESFLPTLLDLHQRFPRLRIVLEHCTTAAAVEAVKKCGPTVAATITAHHLYLTIDQWADNPHCFCKPVAKLPSDRAALVEAATSGNPKFFLGTDSAPHPKSAKVGTTTGKTAAGVFTQPYAVQYVASAFDRVGKVDKLENFACHFGRTYYKVVEKGLESNEGRSGSIILTKDSNVVVREIGEGDGVVVPFLAGEKVWSLVWKN
ncbi:dihydroorotase [Rhizina undulata]